VKLNRNGRYDVQPQICLSLAALFVLCLAFSPAVVQAQTYKQNDIYTIVGGGKTPTTPLTADLPGASATLKILPAIFTSPRRTLLMFSS